MVVKYILFGTSRRLVEVSCKCTYFDWEAVKMFVSQTWLIRHWSWVGEKKVQSILENVGAFCVMRCWKDILKKVTQTTTALWYSQISACVLTQLTILNQRSRIHILVKLLIHILLWKYFALCICPAFVVRKPFVLFCLNVSHKDIKFNTKTVCLNVYPQMRSNQIFYIQSTSFERHYWKETTLFSKGICKCWLTARLQNSHVMKDMAKAYNPNL